MEIGRNILIPNNNSNRNQHDLGDHRHDDDDDNNQWSSSSSVCRFGTTPIFNQNDYHHHQPYYNNMRSESSHEMCLKLGKRNYFEDTSAPASDRQQQTAANAVTCFDYASKRNRSLFRNSSDISLNNCGGGGGWETNSSTMMTNGVPEAMVRCQVEGCNVALGNAKEYHRRHKVCELHSKAPKVVVLGLQQRFCQQCSRFHAISEFDGTKRSCRRRLAGHNERRRKSPHDNLLKNNPSQENKLRTGRHLSYLPSSPTGRALSLLSSKRDHHPNHNHSYCITPPDLSSRSSAALRELIAENRATILSNQLLVVQDRDLHWHEHNNAQPNHSSVFLSRQQNQTFNEQLSLDRYHEEGGPHITLDLMQAPSSAFGFLSMRGKAKNEEAEQGSNELWNSLEVEGANMA